MRIWVDADACPREVRMVLLRASRRLEIPLVLVANHELGVPTSSLVQMRIVPPRADEADEAIAREVEPGDLVITADVPLAAKVVEKGADALDPRGEEFTADDVHARLSMRNNLPWPQRQLLLYRHDKAPCLQTQRSCFHVMKATKNLMTQQGGPLSRRLPPTESEIWLQEANLLAGKLSYLKV